MIKSCSFSTLFVTHHKSSNETYNLTKSKRSLKPNKHIFNYFKITTLTVKEKINVQKHSSDIMTIIQIRNREAVLKLNKKKPNTVKRI